MSKLSAYFDAHELLEPARHWSNRHVGQRELSPVKSDGSKIDRRFLLVRLQFRRYLVPPEKMQKFCDAVVNADEPRKEYPGAFWPRLPFAQAEAVPYCPSGGQATSVTISQSAKSPK
jgi:hypothetical protein